MFTDYSLEGPGVKYKAISVSSGEQIGVSPAGSLDPPGLLADCGSEEAGTMYRVLSGLLEVLAILLMNCCWHGL